LEKQNQRRRGTRLISEEESKAKKVVKVGTRRRQVGKVRGTLGVQLTGVRGRLPKIVNVRPSSNDETKGQARKTDATLDGKKRVPNTPSNCEKVLQGNLDPTEIEKKGTAGVQYGVPGCASNWEQNIYLTVSRTNPN